MRRLRIENHVCIFMQSIRPRGGAVNFRPASGAFLTRPPRLASEAVTSPSVGWRAFQAWWARTQADQSLRGPPQRGACDLSSSHLSMSRARWQPGFARDFPELRLGNGLGEKSAGGLLFALDSNVGPERGRSRIWLAAPRSPDASLPAGAGKRSRCGGRDPGYRRLRQYVNPVRCSFFQVLEQRIGRLAQRISAQKAKKGMA